MRKRIVIGLIAAVTIGVGVYVVSELSGPKRGSVEWHKREYLKAHDLGMVHEFVLNRGLYSVEEAFWRKKTNRIDLHRQALIDAGYFGQKVFVVSNRPPRDVAKALYRTMFDAFWDTNDPIAVPTIRNVGSNSVTLVAVSNQMYKWDELIRQADVPETGK